MSPVPALPKDDCFLLITLTEVTGVLGDVVMFVRQNYCREVAKTKKSELLPGALKTKGEILEIHTQNEREKLKKW